MLLHILPVLHKVREDYNWASSYLSLFLGVPVAIYEVGRYYPAHHESYFRLGDSRLDEDMIISGMVSNGETDIELQIGPVPAHMIAGFTPGSVTLQQLFRLSEMFFAIDKEIHLKIETTPESHSFRTDDDTHSFLELSTFI